MSNTQIWIFGILAFSVLITLITKLTSHRAPWPIARSDDHQLRALANTCVEQQRTVDDRLDRIASDLAEVKATLISIEQTLQVVD